MPEQHRKYLSYNADNFTEWAKSVGSNTASVVNQFLESGREPEQGYKSCVSLMNLARKHSEQKLEKACEQVIRYASAPSIRTITAAIKASSKSSAEEAPAKQDSNHHGITRGAAYFSRRKEVSSDE